MNVVARKVISALSINMTNLFTQEMYNSIVSYAQNVFQYSAAQIGQLYQVIYYTLMRAMDKNQFPVPELLTNNLQGSVITRFNILRASGINGFTTYAQIKGYQDNIPVTVNTWADFQAALGAGVQKIILAPGTYVAASDADVPSNVSIQGSGIGVTIIQNANTLTNAALNIIGTTKITISDITFDMNNVNFAGVTATDPLTYLTVENCEFINGAVTAIVLTNAASGFIRIIGNRFAGLNDSTIQNSAFLGTIYANNFQHNITSLNGDFYSGITTITENTYINVDSEIVIRAFQLVCTKNCILNSYGLEYQTPSTAFDGGLVISENFIFGSEDAQAALINSANLINTTIRANYVTSNGATQGIAVASDGSTRIAMVDNYFDIEGTVADLNGTITSALVTGNNLAPDVPLTISGISNINPCDNGSSLSITIAAPIILNGDRTAVNKISLDTGGNAVTLNGLPPEAAGHKLILECSANTWVINAGDINFTSITANAGQSCTVEWTGFGWNVYGPGNTTVVP